MCMSDNKAMLLRCLAVVVISTIESIVYCPAYVLHSLVVTP